MQRCVPGAAQHEVVRCNPGPHGEVEEMGDDTLQPQVIAPNGAGLVHHREARALSLPADL